MKGNLKLVGSGKHNNDPYDMNGIEWGSDQFIEKGGQAELEQENQEGRYRMEQALDVMRGI